MWRSPLLMPHRQTFSDTPRVHGCPPDAASTARLLVMTQRKKSVPRDQKTKVFLVDPHPLVRAGLRALLDSTPDFAVCVEAENRAEALRGIQRIQPDLLLVDPWFDGCAIREVVQEIRTVSPRTKTCVWSMLDSTMHALRAFEAGATGYVPKQLRPEDLLQLLRRVVAGERVCGIHHAPNSTTIRRGAAGPFRLLSETELQVAIKLGQGATTNAIASEFKLSMREVTAHRKALGKKLGLRPGPPLLELCFHLAQLYEKMESPDRTRNPSAGPAR